MWIAGYNYSSRKMDAEEQNIDGWQRMVSGLGSTGSNKLKSRFIISKIWNNNYNNNKNYTEKQSECLTHYNIKGIKKKKTKCLQISHITSSAIIVMSLVRYSSAVPKRLDQHS